MKKFAWSVAFLLATLCYGQKQPQISPAEEKDLREAIGLAGNSPVEFVRGLEKHLEKYPNSPQRDELERALVKAAIDARDNPRILKYGERVLARNMDNPQVLEKVARLLLDSDDKKKNERALAYAQKFEQIMRALEKEGPSASIRDRGRMLDELDRAVARALVFQARATGNLGEIDAALKLANQSWDRLPTAEGAREQARWLARLGRNQEAVQRYADAFVDSQSTGAERAKDRARMGELYKKTKGSEAGLGEVMLEAYDRSVELTAKRAAISRERDPNSDRTDPLEFALTGVDGEKLALKSLRGKVVVFDFWATWCRPCRVQHPLYEQAKKRFANEPDVVFLAINTDEEREIVPQFLTDQNWPAKSVYYEDGLSALLRVDSIPTTIIIDRTGRISSRLNGFIADRFVDMLSERISEALKTK